MAEWIVYDPLDADTYTFSTEQEAVDHATHLIETYLDDCCWAEEVLDIYVAQRTHFIRRNVLGVRSEMTDDEWEALTNGLGDEADEWWDHDLVPVDRGHSQAPTAGGE